MVREQKEQFHKKWLAAIIAATLCLISPFSALGASDPLAEYKAEQAKLEQEMKNQQAELAKATKNLKEVQSQLKAIDIKISTKESELRSLKQQQGVVQTHLDATNQELAVAEADLQERLEAFSGRLRESYVEGQVTMIDVFFASTSMEDFITRSYYMEKLVEYDLNMMNEIKTTIAVVEEKKATILAQQATLDEMRTIQEGIMVSLNDDYAEQQVIVQGAKNDKYEEAKALAALEKASKDIEKQIAKAQAELNWTGQGTGKYMWPVTGCTSISSEYGYRTHPVTGKKNSFHTGIDIRASSGTPIHAVDSGIVVLSQWYGAYGNCVVVDHGNNLTSLYGHMVSRGVSVGDEVSKGDVIGKVGTTGWSTGNHLHIEFRLNGKHTNPWNYLAKP